MVIPHRFILLSIMLSAIVFASTPGDTKAAQVRYPDSLVYSEALAATYPLLFHTVEEIRARREEYHAGDARLRKYVASRRAFAEPVMGMDDTQLRALLPPVGQPVVYGLGMRVDPHGTILKWAGIENPHCVLGKGDVVYPNEEYSDDGGGWVGKDGTKCYFRARAAGYLYDWLEKMLFALADCHAVTGENIYAHKAAVLLDALAPRYAADKRGPLDYPTSSRDMDRGGRLNKPYYQVARGLMRYTWCFESIMPSGEMGKPSFTAPGKTIFDNVARNILFNGGIYCLGYALDGVQLHNGHADYLRGTASVGLLLGIPEMVEPLLDKAIGLQTMFDVSIDRDSFYVESSHGYSNHTLTLYMDLADFQEAAVRQNIPNATSIYDTPAFFNLLFRYFDRAEVGGRLPAIGDGGPDRGVAPSGNPRARGPGVPQVDSALLNQLNCAWYLWSRVKTPEHKRLCAEFLHAAYGDSPDVPFIHDILLHISPKEMASLLGTPVPPGYFDSHSALYGGKGYAILRGGRLGENGHTHGIQLLCGALHNHSHFECLSWLFYNLGAEWSFDPGYYNTHYRFGWTSVSVSHNQVTFNAKNAVPSGTGEVLAWQAEGSAQYVYVRNPEGYRDEGAVRNERFIAQADAPDGTLDYWLDVSFAKGGEFRDDSFHCVMRRAESELAFTPMPQFSLGGDRFKGQHFLPDYRLSGEKDKPFYWFPEGDGYTFLLEPDKATPAGEETLRFRFTNAAFPNIAALKQAITVDFPGAPNREYYRAMPMAVFDSVSVPYIIRRDHGPGLSIFAKVLHFADETAETTRVSAVRRLPVTPVTEAVCAYEVVLADGRRDCWFIGDYKEHAFARQKSNALVDVWRYAADGSLCEHHRSGDAATGRVTRVEEDAEGVKLTIAWDRKPSESHSGVMVSYGAGRPANWTVESISGETVVLKASKTHIGRLEFTPTADGSFDIRPLSSFFFGRGGYLDDATFAGRHILDDAGKVVAKGEAFVRNEGERLKLRLSKPIPAGFYRISEIAPGDVIRLLE